MIYTKKHMYEDLQLRNVSWGTKPPKKSSWDKIGGFNVEIAMRTSTCKTLDDRPWMAGL